MILLFHISVALISLGLTTFAALYPSLNKLYVSYVAIGLTLASGTYLVISLHTPMLKACATGLIYLAAAMTGVVVAHRRLASERSDIN